jgi:hypothetical protein
LSPEVAAPLRAIQDPVHFAEYAIPAGFTLWAIASTALAFNAAKDHFDKKDKQRARAKNLERFTRRRAISPNAPMFISEEGFAVGNEDKAKKKKAVNKQQSVRIPEASPAPSEVPAEVDKRDPYAALLK